MHFHWTFASDQAPYGKFQLDVNVINPYVLNPRAAKRVRLQNIVEIIKPIRIMSGFNKSNGKRKMVMKQIDNDDGRIISRAFEFGSSFDYWNPDESNRQDQYIEPIMDSLKAEVMNPDIGKHAITNNGWNDIMEKAEDLHSRMYSKHRKNDAIDPIYAKRKPYFNKLFKIEPGAQMSLDHILAVILYTDTDDLQRYFKEHTRRMQDDEDIAVKNRKFANWFRLLFEVIWLFGDELPRGGKVYHGITQQLMFKKFEYRFKAPLSTSTSRNVAQLFCSRHGDLKGAVLQLVNGESFPQPYFSTKKFSKYPEEEEYLFFESTLWIKNIYMLNEYGHWTEYKKSVRVYNFYMKLMSGNELSRTKKLNWCCKHTLGLIQKHIRYLNGDSDIDSDSYFWRQFLHFTRNNRNIWINLDQLLSLEGTHGQELLELLVTITVEYPTSYRCVKDARGTFQFGPYLKLLLQNTSVSRIGFAQKYEWVIQPDHLRELEDGQFGEMGLCNEQLWDYAVVDGQRTKIVTFSTRMVLGYEDAVNCVDEKSIGFIWRLEDSNGFESLSVSGELWCPQIDYYVQFWDLKMSEENNTEFGVRNSGHTDLFALSELKKIGTESFHWILTMKVHQIEYEQFEKKEEESLSLNEDISHCVETYESYPRVHYDGNKFRKLNFNVQFNQSSESTGDEIFESERKSNSHCKEIPNISSICAIEKLINEIDIAIGTVQK